MRSDLKSLESCLYLAKKFGFISRAVVWDFLTPKGRTARYAHWRKLQSSPLFAPYFSSGSAPEFLILSPKGKALVGADAVTGVDDIYFIHDEIVMRFCLGVQFGFSTFNIWSEGELKKDRVLAMKEIGDASVSKLPDLLFDVGNSNAFSRFALEIERTRKSRGRYQTMHRAFQRANNVDVILFGVNDLGIEDAIRDEFRGGGLDVLGKEIAFFSIADFLEHHFHAPVRSSSGVSTLGDFFRGVASRFHSSADSSRHGVRGSLREVSSAS